MPKKRIYISISDRDASLLRFIGNRQEECTAMVARRFVLERLYHHLQVDNELLDEDARLAMEERAAVLYGRASKD